MTQGAASKRWWLLDRLGGPAHLGVTTRAVTWRGRADPAVVAGVLERAVAESASLRRIVEGDPPRTGVTSARPRVTELAVGPGTTAREAVEAWAATLPRFALDQGPLLTACVAVGERESAVAVAAHRLAADATGVTHLVEAIAGAVAGQPATPPAAPNAARGSATADADAAVERVRVALSMLEGPLDLPADVARPAVQSHRATSRRYALGDAAWGAVRAAASALGVSAQAIALAATSLLLGRYGRAEHVVFGRVARPAGAGALDAADTLGVVHVPLTGGLTSRALVARCQAEIDATDAHAGVAFEDLLEAIAPPRDASRPPIAPVAFSMSTAPALPEGALALWLPRQATLFDLEVCCEASGAKLWVELVTPSDRVRGDGWLDRMFGHFETLLTGLTRDLDAPVAHLAMITEAERRFVTTEVNERKVFPADVPIHRRIEAHAAAHPTAVAVRCGSDEATYAELDRRANQIARVLRQRGVGRDDHVAVCLDRSVDLIAVLLGIWKASGAYVPIEPTNPPDRIAFVLEDARPRVVIAERKLSDRLPDLAATAGAVFWLDELAAASAREASGPLEDARPTSPDVGAPADALAYVIYTSGSTGMPKGCLIDHRHIGRLLDSTEAYFHFGPSDVWTMFHSVAFDFSVWEIWGALAYGGSVVVVPYLVTRSPADFHRLLEREGVTVLNQTPSAFRQLIDVDRAHGVPELALRTVIFGGEALELESLRPWFDARGDQRPRLVNMYGITETTVHVTYRSLTHADVDAGFASVIGRPIPDLSCYVVDADLNLLPVGVPGELLVGGAGVARGYLRRPELTEARFIADPYDADPRARLYRSGDLVRRLPDGELDYLGRIDQQVKIRGFRIETGEVEAALRKAGLVRDVAVVAQKKPNGETVLVGYVVGEAQSDDLRAAARSRLPEYMVPSAFMRLDAIPLTGNGKLDRRRLPDPFAEGAATLDREAGADAAGASPRSALEEKIAAVFAEVLRLPRVGIDKSFFDLGGSSLDVVTAQKRLESVLGTSINVVTLFEHTTVEALASHLAERQRKRDKREAPVLTPHAAAEPIAVVGMAGRFPGAGDVAAFWQNLVEGKESITWFTPETLDPSLDPALVKDPAYVPARGVLDAPEAFDAAFFGMSPREADVTDPQQRIALELAWEALETAGHDPAKFPGTIGVFAGEYNVTYYLEHVLRRPDIVASVGPFLAMVGNEKDFIATRIAHKLDLTGPALSIHTACSTSLVAIAQAFTALRTGQCDLAIAGAAAVTCPPSSGYVYQEGSMLSPDGHTRPFDARAAGTVFSDGAAFVVLRRLSDAIRDGDTIWAIVRGAAINNDGAAKMSFTAPSAAGQAAVISKALEVAGASADSIGYVEAHGTATPLGDPIEIEGLSRAFRSQTDRKRFCGVGSVKSNFGHIVAASGAAGFIKAVLSLWHGQIPATLHFERANEKLGLDESPFYVVGALTPWARGSVPRRAGVSSFGVGGTNAHVVVEEAPPRPVDPREEERPELLVLSARTDAALDRMAERLSSHLDGGDGSRAALLGEGAAPRTGDVAFTLATGRRAFAQRRFVVAKSLPEAAKLLASNKTVATARARPRVAFVFPGQGSQYLAMGRDLYRAEPTVRAAIDRAAEILRGPGADGTPLLEIRGASGPRSGLDLRSFFDPPPGEEATLEPLLGETAYTQPAIFTLSYALGELWLSLGVEPEVLFGHSVGEFVAACLAGVLTFEDALRLVAIRGRLMQSAERGSMVSVRASAADLGPLLPAGVEIAGYNAPLLSVVAGPDAAIDAAMRAFEERGLAASRLRTSHAFHSAMMDGVVPLFEAEARRVTFRAPSLPIVSTATGAPLTDREATDPAYWARHLRAPVRFTDAVRQVFTDGPDRIVLEVGPRTSATVLTKQSATDPKKQVAIASLDVARGDTGPGAERAAFLRAVGQLWSLGVPVDLSASFAGRSVRRTPLPTYPFEKRRHFIDAPPFRPTTAAPTPVLSVEQPLASATAVTTMSPTPPQTAPTPSRKAALADAVRAVFEEASGVDLSGSDPSATFVELGLDSLSLTQCAQLLSRKVGMTVAFRELIEDLTSVDALCDHLDRELPAEAFAAPAPPPAAPAPVASPGASGAVPAAMGSLFAPAALGAPGAGGADAAWSAASPDAVRIVGQQLELMARQIELLRGQVSSIGAPLGAPGVIAAAVAPSVPTTPAPATAASPTATAAASPAPANGAPADDGVTKKTFGAGARIERTKTVIDASHEKALAAFIDRYVARTAGSKRFTQEHRAALADPRVVTGFKPMWKEIVYPIVVDHSEGAYVFDIDGNRYVDVTCGFGANFLGHRPPYVVKAVHEQLERGFEIGPQHPLAAECASLVRRLTGLERVIFCNTGSEAVLGATRLARTVTGRPLVVAFTGDYHGILDEVIVRGTPSLRSVPGAPGILPSAVQNTLILDYGEDKALSIIEERANDIAAVLVEPVQSRRPDLQPRAFLQKLRTLTKDKDIALIFDEIITGFRLCPGGAQEYFDVRADLATYGKILGGGLPIGAIAGAARYMDALDGGAWQYGDGSVPEVGVTYFAGTFVRHPLALAACKAALEHVLAEGPELQARINRMTEGFVAEVNAFMKKVEAPYELTTCSSWFKLGYPDDLPFGGLLFFWLRNKGVHIWDGRVAFFTTAHTEADVAFVRDAFMSSVLEMQAEGFLPKPKVVDPFAHPPVPGARLGKDRDGSPAWFLPDPKRPGKYLRYDAGAPNGAGAKETT